jgi:pimeloyl-ACP methyl ester carboxylesterase
MVENARRNAMNAVASKISRSLKPMARRWATSRIRDGLRVPAHVWMAGLAGLTTAVPPSESGTITAPTLIIWGGRDELLPLEHSHLLVAAISDSRLIVYEGTAHLVLWEQPERVATNLADFVAGLSMSGQNTTPIS